MRKDLFSAASQPEDLFHGLRYQEEIAMII